MAAATWILWVMCASGVHLSRVHLSRASPVRSSVLVVAGGQNASLSCNLTSDCRDVTWYVLRSEQLLPLLTHTWAKLGDEVVNHHSADRRRVNTAGALETGSVTLEVQDVQERDSGVYFCSGRCGGSVLVNRGVHLVLDEAAGESHQQPCWGLGLCLLPASVVLCVVVVVVGLYLCSGKPGHTCPGSVRCSSSLKTPEDESLHYSSLKHKPRPSSRTASGLVRQDVTYATVANHKKPTGSRDQR